jgi:hypothetical protein
MSLFQTTMQAPADGSEAVTFVPQLGMPQQQQQLKRAATTCQQQQLHNNFNKNGTMKGCKLTKGGVPSTCGLIYYVQM